MQSAVTIGYLIVPYTLRYARVVMASYRGPMGTLYVGTNSQILDSSGSVKLSPGITERPNLPPLFASVPLVGSL